MVLDYDIRYISISFCTLGSRDLLWNGKTLNYYYIPGGSGTKWEPGEKLYRNAVLKRERLERAQQQK